MYVGNCSPIKKQDGLTLIELAVVLVVIGIILGMASNLIGPLTNMQSVNKSKNIIDAAVESIVGFSAQQKRLPSSSELKTVITRSTDGWNQDITYLLDSTLGATNNICGRKTTNLSVRNCIDNSDCTTGTANVDYIDISNIAFIAASNGSNYTLDTDISGNPIIVYKNEKTSSTEYDDIIKWTTLGQLRTKIGCEGAPLRIVNNELPYGYAGTNYTAIIYAEGGANTKIYNWCVDTSDFPTEFIDPTSGCTVPVNCYSANDSDWIGSSNVQILGPGSSNSESGSYRIKVYVKDGDSNCAEKTYVLTLNPT